MRISTIRWTYFIVVILFLGTSLSAQTVIRVNCGGNEYWDTERNLWYADQPYTPGSWGYENPGYFLYYDYPISGTNDDPLYQYEHNALDNYKFTVPNGTYVVTLKFAELYYDNVGERVFHVDIEGERVLNNFDIFAEVGFAAACDKTFIIDVNDGILDIQFITIEKEPGVTLAHANIKAIAVVEQGTHEPKLWVDPHELDFYDYSYKQSFKVKNGGELPLEWSCAENPDEPWITSVSPTSGTLYQGQYQYVEVQVSRAGLPDGHYEGNISITSNGGNDQVKVMMDVISKFASLQVQPLKLDYGAILTQTSFTIKNVGNADLNWSAQNKNSDAWIKEFLPVSGKVEPGKSQEIQVSVDRSGLTDSTYHGVISISSNGGSENVELLLTTYNKPLTINCGGSEYVDKEQHHWSNDLGFVGGQTGYSTVPIENTENDQLYQSFRSGMTRYQFAVQKNGYYQIVLHFAELQHSAAGKRIFHVKIEDQLVLKDFDIFAQHGKNYAVIKTAQIEVKDAQLDIIFEKQIGDPCIAGIELHQIPFLQMDTSSLNFASILTKRSFVLRNYGTLDLAWSVKNERNDPWLVSISPSNGKLPPQTSRTVTITIDRANLTDSLYQGNLIVETNAGNETVTMVFETKNKPLRINCAGNDYLDQGLNSWLADMLFVGGRTTTCQDSIANTDDDLIYQTNRCGMSKYQFALQKNGWYVVTLHFAETQHHSSGKRVFDVKIEDQIVLENFDIHAEVGSFAACIKTTQVEVNDQQLDISFIAKTGEPCVAGIEVFLKPMMAVQPATLKFGALLTRRHFLVVNAGPVELQWRATHSGDVPWITSISPSSGTLAPSDTQLVTAIIDRTSLTDSLYQGQINIESDAGVQNIILEAQTTHQPLRINCAGGEYLDRNNQLWFDDLLVSAGQIVTCQDSIANTAEDQLYQTAWIGLSKYELPVQYNGLYGFALHFAEIQHQAVGSRVFDVQIEDSVMFKDLDIYAEAGSFTALVKLGKIRVTDHQLDIRFIAKTGAPLISAIEIYQSPLLAVAPTSLQFGSMLVQRRFSFTNMGSIPMHWSVVNPSSLPWVKQIVPSSGVLAPSDTQAVIVTIDRSDLPDSLEFDGMLEVISDGGDQPIALHLNTSKQPLRINCGGQEWLDVDRNYWFEDVFASAGRSVTSLDSIANSENGWLYQTVQMGATRYELPIQNNGRYQITLHFVELFHQAAGKRIFDVQIEDSLVLTNLDIFAECGDHTALVKQVVVTVKDHQLDIEFIAKTDDPVIAGIEVAEAPEIPTDLSQNDGHPPMPDRFQLEQNYPNPFNMETRIHFALPIAGSVTLEVYNLLGQKQRTLVQQEMRPGFHSILWDGRDSQGAEVSSGVYLYKIQVTPKDAQQPSFQGMKKMLLLK